MIVFSLIFTFIIKPFIDNLNLTPNIDVVNYLSNLSNIALKADNYIYEKGIWDLLDSNKNQYYDFTKEILNIMKMHLF